ncbi:MAG: OB-fold nucleic acid binding domain-containing protein, partial [Desulfitobacteriaceae bacterium]|nr:OB-fold nucleic acid binding domain-containing protein [Desulfitobacteriaceae bacterium]
MEKILKELTKTIKKEEKLGLTNAAVFGGFSNYFVGTLTKVLPRISEPSLKQQLIEIKSLAEHYRDETIAERRGTLRKISLLLEGIDPGSFPRLTQGKPKTAHTSNLVTPVQYLKNVGPKRDELFHKIGVRTVQDLLEYYPWRYEDRRMLKKIIELLPGQVETVRGRVTQWEEFKPRPRLSILKTRLTDETGGVWAVWFNQQYLKKQLKSGDEIIVHGKIEKRFAQTEIMVQDFEVVEGEDSLAGSRIVPVYRTTGNLPQKVIRKIIYAAVEKYTANVTECLPISLREKYCLMEKKDALRAMHFPGSPEEQRAARHRLAFEELLLLQLGVLAGASRTKEKGIKHKKDESAWNKFKEILPFPLTAAQERVIG